MSYIQQSAPFSAKGGSRRKPRVPLCFHGHSRLLRKSCAIGIPGVDSPLLETMTRTTLALGVFLFAWNAGASASADVECMCERVLLSEAGCTDAKANAEPKPQLPRSIMWCEQADDPRCMPARAPSDSQTQLITVFPGAVSPDELGSPRETRHRHPTNAQSPHEGVHRRIDRPPRLARPLVRW